MNRFIQIHLLTSYPPSNLNRDDLGRPKTAILGGANRLRVSSQSLKRAWRTSDVFKETLADNLGTRTKEKGVQVYDKLIGNGVKEKDAKEWAKDIAGVFGKLQKEEKKKENKDDKKEDTDKKPKDLKIEQLAHFSPEEESAIAALTDTLISEKRKPKKEELDLLKQSNTAADIAMFGRMLASAPKYNIEAAVQVAHAITVHKVAVEDDFFTAVDDLNNYEDDAGAGHLGDTEFGAGLFYLYICIDRNLLLSNLNEKKELSEKTLAALLQSATTIAPTGKQNSFASRARALYCMAEKGNQQPRSLHTAFLKSIETRNVLQKSIEELETMKSSFDSIYGDSSEGHKSFDVSKKEGSLQELITFIQED
ncbi:MAG: type I-E CRISPR-associated protein Cas7/Cse4/CasC [Spirochaetota bacterium]